MFVHLGGVPGSGKTTLTNTVEQLAERESFPLQRLTGGEILCELAGVDSMAELRALPESVRATLRPEMYRWLYAEDRADPRTVRLGDGHFVLFEVKGQRYGVRQIQPGDAEQTLAMVVITADPETVLSRRRDDVGSRQDRQFSLDAIRREQKLELEVAKSQAEQLQVALEIVPNPDGSIDRTSLDLYERIKQFAFDHPLFIANRS